MSTPDVSIVIPTYNRVALLRRTIESALHQDAPGISYEVVVVDNNCTDNTRDVVETLQRSSGGMLRYVLEKRQGNSYARNTGISSTTAPIIAFSDDDAWVEPNWLRGIVEAFAADPKLSFVGGKVLPEWEHDPPKWLTSAHWAPVALLDYGPEPVRITQQQLRTLFGSNIAIRRDAIERVGAFIPALQRVGDGIGSLEDHELIARLCAGGEGGLYLPELVAQTFVPAARLTKEYHRRWHRGHGRFYAILREPEFERSRKPRPFGVPNHLFREAFTSAVGWPLAALSGKSDVAFWRETRLWFFLGFLRQRMSERKPASA